MPDTFLIGETIYLRPMLASDKGHAAAWHAGPFPIDASRAEKMLKEAHQPGWPPGPTQLVIVRLAADEVVGGARVASWDQRRAQISLHLAAWVADADRLRAEALRLLVPWQRDEREMMVTSVAIAADEPATLAAAEALGMSRAVRLRQRLARAGGRVDQLLYEAYNPLKEVPGA